MQDENEIFANRHYIVCRKCNGFIRECSMRYFTTYTECLIYIRDKYYKRMRQQYEIGFIPNEQQYVQYPVKEFLVYEVFRNSCVMKIPKRKIKKDIWKSQKLNALAEILDLTIEQRKQL